MSNADYQIFEDIIQEMMMVYRHDNRHGSLDIVEAKTLPF